jgi:hypothetical protein
MRATRVPAPSGLRGGGRRLLRGGLHAPCSLDAALGYAWTVRVNLDWAVREVTGRILDRCLDYFPAASLRGHWREIARSFRERKTNTVRGLPPHGAILARISNDVYKVDEARRVRKAPWRRPGRPVKYAGPVELGAQLLAEGELKELAIYNRCKREFPDAPIPDDPASFMRTVRRHLPLTPPG